MIVAVAPWATVDAMSRDIDRVREAGATIDQTLCRFVVYDPVDPAAAAMFRAAVRTHGAAFEGTASWAATVAGDELAAVLAVEDLADVPARGGGAGRVEAVGPLTPRALAQLDELAGLAGWRVEDAAAPAVPAVVVEAPIDTIRRVDPALADALDIVKGGGP